MFDRTFAITTAMQLVTTLVAFIGVLSSLLALQLEKTREMGILRALGLTVAEMRRLTFWETGLLGASAGCWRSPPVTSWLDPDLRDQPALVRLDAANARGPGALRAGVPAGGGAALLAALYPAWRLGRMQVAETLRGE